MNPISTFAMVLGGLILLCLIGAVGTAFAMLVTWMICSPYLLLNLGGWLLIIAFVITFIVSD